MPLESPSTTSVFLDFKLTNTGRQLVSLGRLNFSKVALLDSEVDYSFEEQVLGYSYDITENLVIASTDIPAKTEPINYDGSPAIILNSNNIKVGFDGEEVEYDTFGFFLSSSTEGFLIDTSKCIHTGITTTTNLDGTDTLATTIFTGDSASTVGNLLLLRSHVPSGIGVNPNGSTPFTSLWYRINDLSGSNLILDRELPDISTDTEEVQFYIYPWSGCNTYYASAITATTNIWNLNIVRTINEIGSTGYSQQYLNYGSIEYNGVKHSFGFDRDQRAVGFIHHTNRFTGQTYGDYFEVSATTISIPTLLWHRKPEYRGGRGKVGGHSFSDKKSEIFYDNFAKTRYTKLLDGEDAKSIAVGRVYQDLKLIVITDHELLTALSYKSNRNWTLPPLELSFRDFPNSPDTITTTQGFCRKDKTYLATYYMSSSGAFSTGSTFGHKDIIHCNNISVIHGEELQDGTRPYLVAKLDGKLFPYLRSTGNIASYSGTGWNANLVNILIKEVDKSTFSGVGTVDYADWKKLTGNGDYAGNAGETTISASGLSSNLFVITNGDFSAATTYNLPSYWYNSEIAMSGSNKGMWYGAEDFFFGNIKIKTVNKSNKLTIKFGVPAHLYNGTKNETFDRTINQNVYITGVALYDQKDRLIGIAKPTEPIRKNESKHLEFMLELIYSPS